MSPSISHRIFLSSLCLSVLAEVTSCGGTNNATSDGNPNVAGTGSSAVDDGTHLLLLGALDSDAAKCIAQADASAAYLAAGTLDLAFGTSYTALLLVKAEGTTPVSLRGVMVTLTTTNGTVLGNYSASGTGFIAADPATSTAYGTMAVTVLPAELGSSDSVQQEPEIVARIRALGQTSGGVSLTSSELVLPIHLCTGCLVRYPAGAADPTQASGASYRCKTATNEAQQEVRPCTLGQDLPFSCTLCSASYALCRDPSLNPSVQR